ncbi:hypothetical protein DDZ14_09365 [Maritimibacter sp. 55A14]|uniref:hypothetical protein n=1 Tax=Maritimibacter sp. 55A14 TaxID=2174844 RepID=UPI000D6122A5|nr:hypothetical protein [Maritimibacter sp. 55A14]PWE32593.1 hypothetical protein DDZ14_09365 [Maritimibacter sp. 55A14]
MDQAVEIAQAIRHTCWEERQIVGGSGAVGIAAPMSGRVRPEGSVAVLLTGCNLDMRLHHRIVSGEDVDAAAGKETG